MDQHSDAERRALFALVTETNPDALLQLARNAGGRSPVLQQAALSRFAEVLLFVPVSFAKCA